MIYLALPYTSDDAEITKSRFLYAVGVSAKLMAEGAIVICTVIQGHVCTTVDACTPRDWEYWKQYVDKILPTCTTLVVLKLPGWKESIGVQYEIDLAIALDKKIEYFEPIGDRT